MTGGDPGLLTDTQPSPRSRAESRPILGIALAGGAVIQFIGQFTRYGTVTVTPPPDFGAVHRFSYSLFSGDWQVTPWFNATLLTLVIAGVLFALRPSSRRAAFIVGLAGLDVGAFGYALLMLARRPSTVQWGPGFFLNAAGIAIEACVAIVLFVSLWRSIAANGRVSRSMSQLAVGCAVLLGLSTLIWPVTVNRIGSISRYGPWAIGSTLLAGLAFVTAAALPILAVRLGDCVGASVTTGTAVALTISALTDVSTRFSGGLALQHLTVGFWFKVAALGLLLLLGRRLRHSGEPTEQLDAPIRPRGATAVR